MTYMNRVNDGYDFAAECTPPVGSYIVLDKNERTKLFQFD